MLRVPTYLYSCGAMVMLSQRRWESSWVIGGCDGELVSEYGGLRGFLFLLEERV